MVSRQNDGRCKSPSETKTTDDEIQACIDDWLERIEGSDDTDETWRDGLPNSFRTAEMLVAMETMSSDFTEPIDAAAHGAEPLPASQPARRPEKEKAQDINALRELANSTARAAIGRSRRIRFRRQLLSQGAVGAVSLLVGGILYALSPNLQSVLGLSSLGFAALSLLLGLRLLRTWGQYQQGG